LQKPSDRRWNSAFGEPQPRAVDRLRTDYVGHAPLRSSRNPWDFQWHPAGEAIQPSVHGSIRGLQPRPISGPSFGLPCPSQSQRPADQFRRKSSKDDDPSGQRDLSTAVSLQFVHDMRRS